MSLTRRQFIWILGGVTAGTSGLCWLGNDKASGWTACSERNRTGLAMGTKVSLTVVHDDRDVADRALDDAFRTLNHVEEVMSLYRPHSQLSRLNRDGLLRDPDPALITVLTAAEDLARRTDGTFDITVQPLWTLFANAARLGHSPSAIEIAAARTRVDWRAVEMTSNAVRLHGEGTQITLNGIAQGYAVDLVTAVFKRHGIQHALIDTGEIAGIGSKSAAESWRIGIQDPRQTNAYAALVELKGRCLATSGDYATAFNPDRTDHHIFDPRTGRSPTELASVSIVAPNGLWADGLSTAVCVLGVEAGSQLLSTIPNADALFVTKDGKTFSTPGFPMIA